MLRKRAKSAVFMAVMPPHFNTIRHGEPILTVSTDVSQYNTIMKKHSISPSLAAVVNRPNIELPSSYTFKGPGAWV